MQLGKESDPLLAISVQVRSQGHRVPSDFFAEALCVVTKNKYIAAKERAAGVQKAAVIADGCVTPKGPESGISSSSVLPLPPKKMKVAALGLASRSTKALVAIEDDLATTFCSRTPGV